MKALKNIFRRKAFSPDDVAWILADYDLCPKILNLIQTTFSSMDGRIDPPSSMHRMTLQSVTRQMETEILLAITQNQTPIACAFVTELDDAYYIGKLATSEKSRGKGAAKALINWTENLSRDSGNCKPLRLETRIELTENHAVFTRLGFIKTAETAHPGYDRPTSITMEKRITRQPMTPKPSPS